MSHYPSQPVGSEAVPKLVVYVVDDEMDVRMSLNFLLDTLDYQCWPFGEGEDFLDGLSALEPGCVLLDIRMPRINGLEVMAELARRGCSWPVIIMTGHGEISIAVQAMKLGAIEFLEKPFSEEVLQAALTRGFAKLEAACAETARRQSALDRLSALTPRERDVLRELLTGQQNKVVAHNLGLSVRTVEMHRANLLVKLGVRTLPEAATLTALVGSGGLH